MPANIQMGEASLIINGEEKFIRFSLEAQSIIVNTLDLDGIEQIPSLMRKLDATIFSVLIHASLVERGDMTIEDVMKASIPLMPAQKAIVQAINLAMWGDIKGPDPTQEEVEEAIKIAESGASAKH